MRATRWCADDGTVFYNEKECMEYEERVLKEKENMKSRFYNANGEPLLPSKLSGFDIYQQAQYVYLAEGEVEFVNELLEETSFTKPGVYVFGNSDFSDSFVNINDFLQVVEKAKQIVGQ